MTLGQTISKLRKDRHWKQSELAHQLGVTQSMVAKWEGNQARPRSQTLEQLAKALGTTPDQLLQHTDDVAASVNSRPALREIWQYLPQLSDDQLDALKVVVRDMTMRSQMETFFKR